MGARQQRLSRAVAMALLAGRDGGIGAEGGGGAGHRSASIGGADAVDWLDEVVDGVFLLCEQSSWSWAAHDDVFSRSGEVVPDKSRPYLDLGAGEVAAQLAWTDYVLGDSLDARAPGLRRRIRQETQERVIIPFLDRMDWHWLGLDGDVHNWNPWIHYEPDCGSAVPGGRSPTPGSHRCPLHRGPGPFPCLPPRGRCHR